MAGRRPSPPFATAREIRMRSSIWLFRHMSGDFLRIIIPDIDKKGLVSVQARSGKSRGPAWFVLLALSAVFILAPAPAGAIGPGAKGPDVYAVQAMLKSLGSYAGDIDGVYGPLTKRGVAYFQRRYGLSVTGNVDGETLQAILWAYANARIGPARPARPSEPPAPPEERTPGPGTGGALSAEEERMVRLVNEARAEAGLPPLAADLRLGDAADVKSADMVQNHYFSHQSPTYGSPFDMLDRFGIRYRTAGENIACNRDAEAAHAALMASEGHRQNILNPRFTRIGIGIAEGGPCGKMFTQLFAGD